MTAPDPFDGIETTTGAQPQGSVIWLHGLGADASDFVPLVPELVRADWPALRFVFPNAAARPVTLNSGYVMRAWYDLYGLDEHGPEDAAGIAAAADGLDALIAREQARGIAAHRIFVAGFSQGGSVVLATLLRQPQPLAGAVLLSTWLPQCMRPDRVAPAAARATPVFMGHGLHDPIVRHVWGEHSADVLRAGGFAVDWHSYPIQHGVSPQQVADLQRWFEARWRSWS